MFSFFFRSTFVNLKTKNSKIQNIFLKVSLSKIKRKHPKKNSFFFRKSENERKFKQKYFLFTFEIPKFKLKEKLFLEVFLPKILKNQSIKIRNIFLVRSFCGMIFLFKNVE